MHIVPETITGVAGKAARLFLGVWKGIKDVFWGLYRQDCLGLAAQVAYSALFSLFPFLLLLNALVNLFPGSGMVEDWLLGGLRRFVGTESELYRIVSENVFLEMDALSVTLLSVGVILTLWSASGAVMVLLKSIQRAYGLEETRSWQARRGTAVLWAIAGALVIPVGVMLLVFAPRIGVIIGERTGTDSLFHVLWIGLRWPAVLLLLVGLLAVFYRHGSSVRHRWLVVLPGSAFAVGAIIAATQGLSWFISQSWQARWLSYGAIGTVIVLLFWAFLVALSFLVGAQINAVVYERFDGKSKREQSGYDADDKGVADRIPNDE